MSSAKILIVESERIVAVDLQSILNMYGYRHIELAFSSEEAMHKIGSFRPDLLLMDEKLARSSEGQYADGKPGARHGIPVIFISSQNRDMLETKNVRENQCVYVAKPFNEEDIFLSVRKVLSGLPRYQYC